MLLLIKNVHEKTSQQVKTHKILKACMPYNFVICTCVTTLHENALVFSQSEVNNFSCTL